MIHLIRISKYYTLLVGVLSYLLFKSIYAFMFILLSIGAYSSTLDKNSILVLTYSSTVLVILGNLIVVSKVKRVKLAAPLILFGAIIAFRAFSYVANIELAKFMMGNDIDYTLVTHLHGHDGIAVLLFDIGIIVSFLIGIFTANKVPSKGLLDQDSSDVYL